MFLFWKAMFDVYRWNRGKFVIDFSLNSFIKLRKWAIDHFRHFVNNNDEEQIHDVKTKTKLWFWVDDFQSKSQYNKRILSCLLSFLDNINLLYNTVRNKLRHDKKVVSTFKTCNINKSINYIKYNKNWLSHYP